MPLRCAFSNCTEVQSERWSLWGEGRQPVMSFHTFSDRSYWSHQESCRDRLRGAWKWLWWRSSVSYAKHVQLSLYSMQLQLFMYVLCKSMHLLKRLRCYIQLSHSNSFLHASKQRKKQTLHFVDWYQGLRISWAVPICYNSGIEDDG